VKEIPTKNVPSVVQNTHNEVLTGYVPDKWEVHRAGGNVIKYVAIIKNNNNNIRSRYRLNGEHISYTQYFGKNLPNDIKQQVSKDYPDFTILGGQKNILPKRNTEIYRVRLARAGQKSTIFLNANGSKIDMKDVPAELQEEDNQDEK
jgi:hypothetical protein